jgi:hypothetical protein
MAIELQHFEEKDILLTQEQAFRVIRFFWPDASVVPSALSSTDRAFAQALLIEAIDASYKMGFVEHIFNAFYGKVPRSFKDIKDLVKDFAKAAMKHWFKHATGADLRDPQIYEMVRVDIARNFRSTWKIREQSGELTY